MKQYSGHVRWYSTWYLIPAMVIATTALTACVSAPATKRAEPALSAHSVDYYARQIAAKLFSQVSAANTAGYDAPKIAVASFLPVSQLSLTNTDPVEVELANQLSESMLMLAHQHGFAVYDYRLRQQVLLTSDHEQALSRQLDALGKAGEADTILTGTYSQMQDGLMLNVRLISAADKRVVSAASGFIPANVMWSEQKVTTRGGKLYRSDTTGEQ